MLTYADVESENERAERRLQGHGRIADVLPAPQQPHHTAINTFVSVIYNLAPRNLKLVWTHFLHDEAQVIFV
jgi:hypothetical protein